MRNISFMLTREQILRREKDVTRRVGWENIAAGEFLNGVEKGMGLKKGEKVQRLALIRVVNGRREPLRRMIDDAEYGRTECVREGFPHLTPAEFVEFFCRSHSGCTPDTVVTRIEFAYTDFRPFYPSNSDHGIWFEGRFCQNCRGYLNGYCRTLLSAMAHGESPAWVQNDEGERCLSFKDKNDSRTLRRAKNPGGRQAVLL